MPAPEGAHCWDAGGADPGAPSGGPQTGQEGGHLSLAPCLKPSAAEALGTPDLCTAGGGGTPPIRTPRPGGTHSWVQSRPFLKITPIHLMHSLPPRIQAAFMKHLLGAKNWAETRAPNKQECPSPEESHKVARDRSHEQSVRSVLGDRAEGGHPTL